MDSSRSLTKSNASDSEKLLSSSSSESSDTDDKSLSLSQISSEEEN